MTAYFGRFFVVLSYNWFGGCTFHSRTFLPRLEVFCVAKRKRRFVRKVRRVYHPPRTPYDVHHLLWIGRHWGSGHLASLRQYWYCKVSIPRDTLHRFIHENLATIPTPRPQTAKDVLAQLRYLERYDAIHECDPVDRRLEVLIALFDCVEPHTAEALRKQLEIVREFYRPS